MNYHLSSLLDLPGQDNDVTSSLYGRYKQQNKACVRPLNAGFGLSFAKIKVINKNFGHFLCKDFFARKTDTSNFMYWGTQAYWRVIPSNFHQKTFSPIYFYIQLSGW